MFPSYFSHLVHHPYPWFSCLQAGTTAFQGGGAQKQKTTQPSIFKLHLSLYFQRLLHCQRRKIPHRHRQGAVAKVQLQRFGVSSLSEPFNCATVSEKVGVNSLVDSRQPRCFPYHLMRVLAV